MDHLRPELEKLVQYFAKLPGLGPRSARRVILHLFKHRETLMIPLGKGILEIADKLVECNVCGNLDVVDPCSICANAARDQHVLCIVETVGDLWALERTGSYKGKYHVLGGVLAPLDGIKQEDLSIAALESRLATEEIDEVIIALNATVNGQTTSFYLADLIAHQGIKVTQLAHGVPVGGELDYLDEGTLSAALKSRHTL